MADEATGGLSEARRQALEASVAPGADIYLSYEETVALWSADAEAAVLPRSNVVRDIPLGSSPQALYTVTTQATEMEGIAAVQTSIPLFGVSFVVVPSSGCQVPAGQAQ